MLTFLLEKQAYCPSAVIILVIFYIGYIIIKKKLIFSMPISSYSEKGAKKMREIKRVAVLGAGVMGRAIAAHVANAGYAVDLLDRVALDTRNRNQLAEQARTALLNEKPAPLFTPTQVELIRPGNFSDHLDRLAEADWIIEAVIEQKAIKQQLFAAVEQVWNGNAIISSNTHYSVNNWTLTSFSTTFFRHTFF
jgi:hypothetical protein